jgi:SAM-dependent methyltransferase
VPAALRARYFRRIGADAVVNDRLRPHVRFEQHNLASATEGRQLELILCRNVLIYFDEARRAEALARLVRALKPGGWLLVGYSETLRDHPELTAESHAVYRKQQSSVVKGQSSGVSRQLSVPERHRAAASPMVDSAASPAAAAPVVPRVALRGDYVDGKRLAAELRAVVGGAAAVLDLDGATFLGDEAARVLRRAVEAAPALEVRATRPAIRRWLGRHGIRPR